MKRVNHLYETKYTFFIFFFFWYINSIESTKYNYIPLNSHDNFKQQEMTQRC